MIGDNISYIISSTGQIHPVEDPYYSSIISLVPKEEFTSSCQLPLPPIPLSSTLRSEQDTHIQDNSDIQDIGNQGNDMESEDSKIEDSTEVQVSDKNNAKSQVKSKDIQGSETLDTEIHDTEVQDGEIQNRGLQEKEKQDTKTQEKNVQDTEIERDHVYDSFK